MDDLITPALRIIFAGTPEFAAHHLQALLNSSHHVVAVYTQPDRPAGRGKKLTASPVKLLAETHHLPVFQPIELKTDDAQKTLASFNADVMVVVAYGLILPKTILETPSLGCINVHASLLPRWRGAAPIQRAIEAGDNETGITIMQMDVGLDTGDILLQQRCAIADQESAASLHDKLIPLGQETLLTLLNNINALSPIKQNSDDACYAEKLHKEEALIDWHKSATVIERQVRAFNPYPVSFTLLNNERIRIWQAHKIATDTNAKPGTLLDVSNDHIIVACGEAALCIQTIQLAGGKMLSVKSILNAHRDLFKPNMQFTS